MTVRPPVVCERLRKLREILRHLDEVRKIPKDQFLASYRHYWLAERGLHLAAEAVFDVGNHILAGAFNVYPAEYEEVVARLGDHGVITPSLRERMRGLGGFRNVLVHLYLSIDLERIYQSLQEELEVFDAFAEEIESFLEKLEIG